MTRAGRNWRFGACLCLLLSHTALASDTRLIDQYGRPLDAGALAGRWLLVYFGYASCKEICPGALTRMTALLHALGSAADSIDPLFVTLDPAHDTPEVLRAFAAHFDPRLRALSGSPQALQQAARTFNVPWSRSGEGIDHGTLIYLVAPDGHVDQLLHPQQPIPDLAAIVSKRMALAVKS